MKEQKIKGLALLPMELPKEIELDNTLEAMQKFVGGLIECITLSDTGSEVTLVCNDEGKLLGLPLNRPLWDGADVLAGPGFLAGCDNEGNLTSLPQSAMDFYKEKFRASSYDPDRDIVQKGGDFLLKGSLLKYLICEYAQGYSASAIISNLQSEHLLSEFSTAKKIRIDNGTYVDARLLTLKRSCLTEYEDSD